MKIQSIHFNDVGPLGTSSIDFTDDWTGDISTRILLSGPNGCGKSTVLRAVNMLWEAAGHWLDHRVVLPKPHLIREWLQNWTGLAVILAESGVRPSDEPQTIGLIFGEPDWFKSLADQHTDVVWLGETITRTGRPGAPKREFIQPNGDWFEDFSLARKKMILGHEKTTLPNVIFMDAEERRWVTPKRNVGENIAESPNLRWSPRYLATEEWKGQIESSLINLKLTQPRKFKETLDDLNKFLIGKTIEHDIKPGENRLRVRLTAKGPKPGVTQLTIDQLSAGEHQVLIILYLIARWAEKGALVLIDEPDLYLHPSLVSGLLSRIEQMVNDRGGQLIITSHAPDIWSRYENTGKRVELGGAK